MTNRPKRENYKYQIIDQDGNEIGMYFDKMPYIKALEDYINHYDSDKNSVIDGIISESDPDKTKREPIPIESTELYKKVQEINKRTAVCEYCNGRGEVELYRIGYDSIMRKCPHCKQTER